MVRAVPPPDRSGGGAGEAGARPALTRNCERSPSGGREPGPPPRSTGLPVPAERVALGGRVPGPRGTGPAEAAHMRGVRSPRWALLALAVGLVAGAFGTGVVPDVAPAASPHQAAVIVDTGGTVKRVVVTFSEDSITGLDALQRAGANPVVYQFGGQGGAVCRLLGVGRDAGPDCLGGGDGDARYWAYFRAPAGTSSFKYSSVGGGSARVHDGDVEGWKFGTGAAPQYVSVASLLPPPPSPPTQPPAT